MKNKLKYLVCGFSALCLVGSLVFASPSGTETVQAASIFHSTDGTVHFLTLPDNTDAILLECDGKFGMVDSGEDSDYPNGSDARYPLRAGVTTTKGYESQVISYLKKMGVNENNFEFYIGTHPHSDHIGSADEVIRAFHPKRVYLEPYSDSDITDATHLWDNLYVYDQAVTAAKETGATLIQYFNTDAPLYPETVSVKGNIIWKQPEKPEENEKPEDSEKSEESDSDSSSGDTEENSSSSDTSTPESNTSENDSSPDTDLSSDTAGSDMDSESSDQANADTPVTQDTSPNTDISSEEVTGLSVSDETQIAVLPLSTGSTDTVPESEVSAQPVTASSDSPPETISVTLSWGNSNEQSVTLTSGSSSEYGSVTKISENQWTYEFQSIPKYDDTKSAYTYTVTPEADGYSFSKLNDSDYDFSCVAADSTTDTAAYADEALVTQSPDSGVLDSASDISLSGTSDNLVTSSIPSTDRVIAGTDSDSTNANRNDRSISGKSGIYDGETGNVSTPVFYLGDKNKLKIEIMNYGVSRPQPDANYFSLGVKVTSQQTGATAFLSGDINNYLGTETALAAKLGHVNLLKLGHHGCYGSNTYSYIQKLNPNMAIMTGTYSYVSNATVGDEYSTLDTLLAMASRGTPLYATGWYSDNVDALVIHLNASLSNNIPSGKSLVAVGGAIDETNVFVYYKNGFPANCSGWKKDLSGNYYYFQNSSFPLTNQFVLDNSTWYYLDASGKMTTGWVYSNGSYYYMNPSNGAMVTGWFQLNNIWYYLGDDGWL